MTTETLNDNYLKPTRGFSHAIGNPYTLDFAIEIIDELRNEYPEHGFFVRRTNPDDKDSLVVILTSHISPTHDFGQLHKRVEEIANRKCEAIARAWKASH